MSMLMTRLMKIATGHRRRMTLALALALAWRKLVPSD
jgi:hypothetical protein